MKLLSLIHFRLNVIAFSLNRDLFEEHTFPKDIEEKLESLKQFCRKEDTIAYLNYLKEMELDLFQVQKVQTPITLKWIQILEDKKEYEDLTHTLRELHSAFCELYKDTMILEDTVLFFNRSKEIEADFFLEILGHIKTLVNPSFKVLPSYNPSDSYDFALDHFWEERIRLVEFNF